MEDFQASTVKPPVALAQDSPHWRTSRGTPWFGCFPSDCRDKRWDLLQTSWSWGTLVWRDTLIGKCQHTYFITSLRIWRGLLVIFANTYHSEVRLQSVSVAAPRVAHSCTLFLSKHEMLKASSSKWLQFSQESEGRLRLAEQRCQSSGRFVTRLPGITFPRAQENHLLSIYQPCTSVLGGHYVI